MILSVNDMLMICSVIFDCWLDVLMFKDVKFIIICWCYLVCKGFILMIMNIYGFVCLINWFYFICYEYL